MFSEMLSIANWKVPCFGEEAGLTKASRRAITDTDEQPQTEMLT